MSRDNSIGQMSDSMALMQSQTDYPVRGILGCFNCQEISSESLHTHITERFKLAVGFPVSIASNNQDNQLKEYIGMYMRSKGLNVELERIQHSLIGSTSEFYSSELILELFFYYIELLFSNDCSYLCSFFGMFCCESHIHTEDCSEKWQTLKTYFYVEMIGGLGISPLYFYKKGISYGSPGSKASRSGLPINNSMNTD